jgi:hypothetical protein
MVRECFKAKTGIMFVADGLRKVGLDPRSIYPVVLERPPAIPIGDACIEHTHNHTDLLSSAPVAPFKTEEEAELLDALSPIFDQLSLAPFWWILELLPVKQHAQKENNTWETRYRSNMGEGRRIPRQKKGTIKIHRSVKMRMEAQYPDGEKYQPKASFKKALALGNVVWVD